jgi:hypothetical protein
MAERIKKYAIVVFLTFLVWAWAFNDLEKTETRTATLTIAKNPDSDIFVTFDPQAPVEMELDFKGTPAKIDDLINRIDAAQEDLKFVFNPENEKKESPYTLDILDFLHDSSKIRKLELAVLDSSVKFVQVKVQKLVKMPLKIKCVDENGDDIKVKTIDPSTVNIFVPEGYTGDATVILSERDVAAARKDYVIRVPFVTLSPTEKREGEPVKIELPSIDLDPKSIQTKRIGYSFGKNIMGRYKIVLLNENKLTSAIMLKATPPAYDAYDNMPIQIIIQALDTDETNTGTITRDVIYNFPTEEVANGHIWLADGKPKQAEFKLVKIPQAPTN